VGGGLCDSSLADSPKFFVCLCSPCSRNYVTACVMDRPGVFFGGVRFGRFQARLVRWGGGGVAWAEVPRSMTRLTWIKVPRSISVGTRTPPRQYYCPIHILIYTDTKSRDGDSSHFVCFAVF
jgi:hypothetical protein